MNEPVQFPRFRWFVLLTVCIVTAVTAMVMISPAPLIGVIAKTMGLSLGEVSGITMGIFNLFMAISAVVGGILIDRFGVMRIWLVSLALLILGGVLIPFIGNIAAGMTAIRVLVGCGTGPVMASVVAIAAQWFPIQERGIVTGIQGFAVSLGIALGFVLVPGLLQSTGNWQAALSWLDIGTLIAVGLTLIVAFGPKPPLDHLATASPQTSDNGRDLKQALLQIATWAGIAATFFTSWQYQAFNDLTPAYLAVEPPVGVGLGPMGAGKLMLAVQIAYMLGSLLSGIIGEKVFGGRARPIVVACFLVSAVFMVTPKFPAVYSNETTLLVCLIGAGLFVAPINPQIFAFIAKNYPEHITGKLAGVVMALSGFGATTGVSLGAYALHTTGLYQMSINLVGIAAIAGLFAALFLSPPKIFYSGSINPPIDRNAQS